MNKRFDPARQAPAFSDRTINPVLYRGRASMARLISAATITTLLTGLPLSATAYHASEELSEFEQYQRANDFSQYQTDEQQAFRQYLKQQDQEFLAMLKADWQGFQTQRALRRDNTPKPDKQPSQKPLIEQPISYLSSIQDLVFPATVTRQQAQFEFYGHQIALANVLGDKWPLLRTPDQYALRVFWLKLAEQDFDPLVEQLTSYRQQLQLSDWATWLMVERYSQSIYQRQQEQIAYAWYLLNQLGLQARIGYNEQGFILMTPASQTLYGKHYYLIDGQKFYAIAGNSDGQVYKSYDSKGIFASNRPMDLRFEKTLLTKPDIRERKLTFQHQQQNHELSIAYDFQRIRYFSSYPQIDLQHYFNADIDSITSQSLIKQLTPFVKQNNETDNINTLLNFVQHAFNYAIDEQQFGQENYLLPEETLHYAASDCEDRAFLFSWLTRTLTQQQPVGVVYDGHVATAFKPAGSQQYILADPTYAGAKIGEVMPQYKNQTPKYLSDS